ncbi:MAG: twin-arginine translocase TatA/TatE family subunit [Proteobacteria bacterium]|nr:twin-arginine translocase TatA/TatE family subunit [Pseudomonadota bacterium]MBI3498898.1 twin-arginine translocase TatA/TatE family subunit [Pseudomonadota bacterium]
MGSFSIWHWLIVLAVVLILFGGGGKISKLMGDFGKGLKAFKRGLAEEGEAQAGQPATAIKADAMGPTQPHDAAAPTHPRTDQPARS